MASGINPHYNTIRVTTLLVTKLSVMVTGGEGDSKQYISMNVAHKINPYWAGHISLLTPGTLEQISKTLACDFMPKSVRKLYCWIAQCVPNVPQENWRMAAHPLHDGCDHVLAGWRAGQSMSAG